MKKMKYVILLLLAVVVFPFSVFAEGEEVIATNEGSKKVNVYHIVKKLKNGLRVLKVNMGNTFKLLIMKLGMMKIMLL